MDPFEIIVGDEGRHPSGYKQPLYLIVGVLLIAVNLGIIAQQLINAEFNSSFPGSWIYGGNALLGFAATSRYFKAPRSRKLSYNGRQLVHNLDSASAEVSFDIDQVEEIRHYATSTEVRLNDGRSFLIPMGDMTYLDVQRVKALLSRDNE